jgi:hypothetical protein
MTAVRSSTVCRTLAVAAGALALACGAAQAAPAGWHGGGGHGAYHGGGDWHGGWHGGNGWHGGGWYGGGGWHAGYHWGYRSGWGWGWWDPVILGVALATAPAYYYDSPDYVVVNPAPVYVNPPAPVYVNPPAAPAPRTADPIFYPRNGQTAQQTEADRQDCNRWATTQPNAMNDASIFQRATFACMDGRGYTVR